jgi:hypothetical protein
LGGHCGANTERRKSPLTGRNPSMSFLSKRVVLMIFSLLT